MDQNATISVIIPAYNVEKWIGRCIESVCGQTYRELEIIVVDDGSTDDTGKIIDSYAEKDSRVKAIHKENGGLVEARETGISAATGDHVGFVDGDDMIMSDMYERLLANALKYDADISHCGMSFCFPSGKEEPHYGTGAVRVSDNFEGQKDLLEGRFVEPSLSNKLYKRELLIDSCLDKTVLNNEDLLRNFVLFKRARKSVFEDICGYRYMQRSDSMSSDSSGRVRALGHVLRARRIIVENSDREIRPYAMACYLGCAVNAVKMYGDKGTGERSFCEECRNLLKSNRSEWHCLIPRQRIFARMAVYFPRMYSLLFGAYSRIVRRQK